MSGSLSEKALRVLGIKQEQARTSGKEEKQPPKQNVSVAAKTKPASPAKQIQGLVIHANTTTGPSMDQFPLGARPIAYHGTLCTVEPIYFDPDIVANTDWKTADLTARLGFPLNFARSRWTPENRKDAYNSQSHLFMLYVNGQSDDFGKFAVSPAEGDVVVTRADGKPLMKHELAITFEYIARYIAEDVKGLPDLKDDLAADRKAWIVDHLDPKTFRQYLGASLAQRVAKGTLDDKDAKNPVQG